MHNYQSEVNFLMLRMVLFAIGLILMDCVIAGEERELVFEEQFDGTNSELDKSWRFQNGPSAHILCSHW
jgi:hypothetical protein